MKSESIYWDLSTQPFLVFKNIGTKKKKDIQRDTGSEILRAEMAC